MKARTISVKSLKKQVRTIVLGLMLLPIISGCVETRQQRGYMMDAERIAEVEIGKSGKADVRRILGTPSSTSDYGQDTWYYIGMQMARVAFLAPEIKEQQVLEVSFTPEGKVLDMVLHQGEKRRSIAFAEDATPTEGNEITIIQQLLGNLGRFNAPE